VQRASSATPPGSRPTGSGLIGAWSPVGVLAGADGREGTVLQRQPASAGLMGHPAQRDVGQAASLGMTAKGRSQERVNGSVVRIVRCEHPVEWSCLFDKIVRQLNGPPGHIR
jgi:hypothetical protein